jgi:hypothetical protein
MQDSFCLGLTLHLGAVGESLLQECSQGCAEGPSPFAEGLGVSPNSILLPPRVGVRGLKRAC